MTYMDLDIVYEDDDIIICIKPSGVFSQTKSMTAQDMVSLITNYRAGKGQDTYVAILQRLDTPVYGLMAFAKNKKAAAFFSKQINDKVMKKSYMAVVSGPVKESDVLEDYLLKDGKTNKSKSVSKDTKGAKYAKLSYELVERRDDYALIRINLFTGRHHQIRAQLAARDIHIIGDVKYGAPKVSGPAIGLAAYRIELVKANNEKISFDIPLDKAEFFRDFY